MSERIRKVLKKYGVSPRKRWGQNFLRDEGVLEKIARAAELNKDDLVLEVGAGTGVLTEKLAASALGVVAVEFDRGLCGILKDRLAGFDNVVIIQDDILKVNLGEVLESSNFRSAAFPPIKVIGNLPYYITTPIIFHLLRQKSLLGLLVLMVQREVGERLAATPGGKDYGVLTLACRYYAEVKIVARVGRESFFPVPGVDSVLVKFRILKEPRVKVEDEELLFSLIKSAFGQRRKTLENALSAAGHPGLGKKKLKQALGEAGIEGRRRGETLSLEEFGRLSNILEHKEMRSKATNFLASGREEWG